MDDYKRPLDENTIDENFGSLLTIREDKDKRRCIFFRHQSGREFFTHEGNVALFHDPGDINPDMRIARTCLSYLNARDFKHLLSDLSHKVTISKTHPFIAYASLNWYKHIRTRQDSENEDVAPQIESVTDKNHSASQVWTRSFLECNRSVLYVTSQYSRMGKQDYSSGDILASLILRLNIPWLTEKIPSDDLVGHDIEFANMLNENPESFASICFHRGDQMSYILSANFAEPLLFHPTVKTQEAIRILFENAPRIKSKMPQEFLESINPHGNSKGYEVMVEFLLRNGFIITDNCLRQAAKCGSKGTLTVLLKHQNGDLKIFNEFVHVAVTNHSDTLCDLLDTFRSQYQLNNVHVTSAIDSGDIHAFEILLKHRRSDECTSNDDFLELLFRQNLLKDLTFRDNNFMKQRRNIDAKVEFTKAALSILYNKLPDSVKVAGSTLIESLCNINVIVGTEIVEFLSLARIGFEITAEVITTFAKYRLSIEVELHQKTSDLQAMKPFEWIRKSPRYPHLIFYTWRASLSTREVMKIFVNRFDPESSLRKSLLHSAVGEIGDVLLGSLDSGQINGIDHWTTLHYAAYFKDIQVAKKEIKSGADVNSRTRMGLTPLHIAVLSSFLRIDFAATPWIELRMEAVTEFIRLLFENCADPNIRDNSGGIPLYYAVCHQYQDFVNVIPLLQSDVNARDECGFTPLHYSVLRSNREMIKHILLDQKQVVQIDSTDIIFQTPLHYAIQRRDDETIRLLQDGTDLSLLNAYGKTCIESMQENGLQTQSLHYLDPQYIPPSQAQRNLRLHNVVYVITSRLLNNSPGFIHPGLYELGSCLIYLGEREEAVVAYEQMTINMIDYENAFCRRCRSCPTYSFHIPIDCPTGILCDCCIKYSNSKGLLAIPSPSYSNRDRKFANHGGETVVEWLERIRQQFGIDPQVEMGEGNIALVDSTCGDEKVLADEEQLAASETHTSIDHIHVKKEAPVVDREEASTKREESLAKESLKFDQANDIQSMWPRLIKFALDIKIWLVGIVVLVSIYLGMLWVSMLGVYY